MGKPINCDHITDEYIEQAFEGTNFGPVNKRKMLEQGCLKAACDSWSGHTLSTIMVEIGFTEETAREVNQTVVVNKTGHRVRVFPVSVF